MPTIKDTVQQHLGLFLDVKLNFSGHINEKIKKTNKDFNVIKKLHLSLPRSSLITVYKSFIRLHLDYGDIIYDQSNNDSFSDKSKPFNATGTSYYRS